MCRLSHMSRVAIASIEAKVIAGARAAVSRWGWRRASVDDIAREAQLSRASVYRCYPGGRGAVMAALLADERARFDAMVSACRRDQLDDTLVELVMATARWFKHHAMLQHVLRHEPDLVGPHLAFAGGDKLLLIMSGQIGELISELLGDAGLGCDRNREELARYVDWFARLLRSHLLIPSSCVASDDPESVRRLVDRLVIPAIAAAPVLGVSR